MAEDKKFYKTVIEVTVLSEIPYETPETLEQVHYDITEGDCSGEIKTVSTEEVDGPTMARLLQTQGSDPGFFQLSEAGEHQEEDITEATGFELIDPAYWVEEERSGG